MLGGRAGASRVTGSSEVLGPIYRVDRLYRNHLDELVLNAWTPYAQPFGSGASDRFAGHKDDPETGMKCFGARYYRATSARWISADSLRAHVYDPRSLNKCACVRNDPVNLVDPDGNQPFTVSITVWRQAPVSWESWWFYDSPSFSVGPWTSGRAGQARGATGSGGGASVGPTIVTHS